jgi:hypothetical protein
VSRVPPSSSAARSTGRTSIADAEEVRRGFANSGYIIVDGSAHTPIPLSEAFSGVVRFSRRSTGEQAPCRGRSISAERCPLRSSLPGARSHSEIDYSECCRSRAAICCPLKPSVPHSAAISRSRSVSTRACRTHLPHAPTARTCRPDGSRPGDGSAVGALAF